MKGYLLYFLVLWLLYYYDTDELIWESELLMLRFKEKGYEDVIKENDKDPLDYFVFRLLFSFFFFLFYLIVIAESFSLLSLLQAIIIMFAVFKGLYLYEYRKYRFELDKACREFPYYLNHLCILINNNPVTNAIYESIELAPDIFKKDLSILVRDIHDGEKEGSLPYMEFSNKYRQVEDLPRIMMTLYNMKNDSSESDILLTSLNHMANEKLSDANKLKFERNLDKQALMPWLGFMWIGLLIISLLMHFDLSALGGI